MDSNENILKEILSEIKQLKNKIDDLENKLDISNDILASHIGFINNVFNAIKRPLFFIMSKVNGVLPLEN